MYKEHPASVEYRAAYEAAKVADDVYQRAAVAEHGPYVGRWATHTRPETIAARAAKIAADTRCHTALKALHAAARGE